MLLTNLNMCFTCLNMLLLYSRNSHNPKRLTLTYPNYKRFAQLKWLRGVSKAADLNSGDYTTATAFAQTRWPPSTGVAAIGTKASSSLPAPPKETPLAASLAAASLPKKRATATLETLSTSSTTTTAPDAGDPNKGTGKRAKK